MIYKALRIIGYLLFVLIFRLKVTGLGNVPSNGGAIICANHSSFLDPVILAVALPREVHHMARDTLFRNPIFAKLITALNAFPIKREGFSRKGFRMAKDLLNKGKIIIVYPEGSRSLNGRLGEAKTGIGMLVVMASGIPVIPVRIIGANKALPRGRFFIRPSFIEVRFGRALHFEIPPCPSRETYRKIAKTIMERIGEL